MTTLRRLLGTALVAVLALALAACGALDEGGGDSKDAAKAKEGATEVKVGYLHTIAVDDKLWLGQAEGQWADAGLDLKTTAFDTGIELSQALAGGSIDVAIMGGVTSNFPAQGQGKIFMLNSRETATARLFVQGDSGITSVADLKGKKVITTEGTTADIYLHRALEKAGPDPQGRHGRQRQDARRRAAPSSAAASRRSPCGCRSTCASTRPARAPRRSTTPATTPTPASVTAGSPTTTGTPTTRTTVKKIIGAWLKVNEAYRNDPEGSLEKVHEIAYKDDAKLTDLQHQVEFQKDYTNEEWLKAYENGDVLTWVGDAEKAYVELGGVPKYVDPKEFFDTSLFIEAAKGSVSDPGAGAPPGTRSGSSASARWACPSPTRWPAPRSGRGVRRGARPPGRAAAAGRPGRRLARRAGAGRATRCCCRCPSAAVVEQVVDEIAPALPGLLILDTSTIGPDDSRRIAALALARGLDLPRHPGPRPARSWSAGGRSRWAARPRRTTRWPTSSSRVARQVVHVGDVGAGRDAEGRQQPDVQRDQRGHGRGAAAGAGRRSRPGRLRRHGRRLGGGHGQRALPLHRAASRRRRLRADVLPRPGPQGQRPRRPARHQPRPRARRRVWQPATCTTGRSRRPRRGGLRRRAPPARGGVRPGGPAKLAERVEPQAGPAAARAIAGRPR